MIPENLARHIQNPSLGTVVQLFELDASVLGGDVYYFCNIAENTDFISFGGQPYTPIPMASEGWEWTAQAAQPTPTLKIANLTDTIGSLVKEFDDLLGCIVTRKRTFSRFLDTGDEPDGDAYFPPDVYRIERKRSHNRLYIEFDLANPVDQQGRYIPGRQVIRDYCYLQYRIWNADLNAFDYSEAECPYTAAIYFNLAGEPVVNPALDRCPKKVGTGCNVRFPNEPLPFGGFPGVARVRG